MADGAAYCSHEPIGAQHIRYGGYGGIAYHHIADSYIALFTSFIPCGVWETVPILDDLMKNRSVIQPDTTSTWRTCQTRFVPTPLPFDLPL
jgi:Tn3 transposase DDE domain